MSVVIKVKNVSKKFNEQKIVGIKNILKNIFEKKENKSLIALDNVSFEVNKGEMIGIIGLNGSGKTTLLRIISGIYQPDNGKIETSGIIAPLLQIGMGFNGEMVADENIMVYGMLLGMSKNQVKQKIDNIIRFAELEEFTKMKLKHYSQGMKSRLGFSTALEIDPDILLVDEVLAVGDARFKKKSFEAFTKFKSKGKTIIYTSHNTGIMKELCEKVILLHHGKVVDIGNPSEVIEKYTDLIKTEK